ncbi:MerC domain-containing protein [Pelagicoccus mobilis]|uniref:MerC domain-containing protein n=1 Tax=Pelagicoccus mobilis TaxID=415221 RepID=A0A934RUJ3_9BACT|nr:MerC domain-containing protein [Pelagicoccus mobilis]MBK1875384.1 MerC domain-containing protein [Pelagicoccus mobilis]
MEVVMQEGETKKWDILGIGLSILCGIHCLSVPFLMGVLPMLGLDFMADHGFEWAMMGIIFLVAGVTYFNGYRRHRRAGVWGFFAVGVLIFAVIRPMLSHDHGHDHFHGFEAHHIATIIGGSVFVLGHWKNWHWHKPSCKKECCSGH